MNLPRILFASLVSASALFGNLRAARAPEHWGPDPFLPLTAERIAKLPAEQRPAWENYWKASQELAAKIPVAAAPEFSPMQPLNAPPRGGAHTKGLRLDAPAQWYASKDAQTIAERVVAAQTAAGAWNKGNDYTQPAKPSSGEGGGWSRGTFDNDATIYELRFLANVQHALADEAASSALRENLRASFLRGVAYLFAAQYPNGGFPQVYPLMGGYHDGVTYNDDGMVHALALLRDIAERRPELDFVPRETALKARERFALGFDCILKTQLRGPHGELTVWCQQYDALTLRPQAARNFEPIADVAHESGPIVALLMKEKPEKKIVAAVEGAIAWFRAAALHDVAWVRDPATSRGELIARPGAPLLWARFYLPGTFTPIFGDRDRTIHFDVAEISAERRAGYAWYGTWPAAVLEEYEVWRKRAR